MLVINFWSIFQRDFNNQEQVYESVRNKQAGLVTKYLSALDVKVLAFDPFLSEEEAKELGVEKTSLENR